MKKYKIISEDKLEDLIQERVRQTVAEVREDYQKETLMRQVDIARLQSQINPHFLYNALECIRGQALIEGSREIADITQALSKYYRYSVSTKGDKVTLKDELDNVKNYMTIQQYRFRGRFSYVLKYDKEDRNVLGTVIPNLTLQPLIENAVLHAFDEMTSGAMLVLRVEKTQSFVEIQVSDNGKGMSPETLEILRNRINGTASDRTLGDQRHTGIALQNVNRRLQLFYGEEFGLTVNSSPGSGTDITLILPMFTQVKA